MPSTFPMVPRRWSSKFTTQGTKPSACRDVPPDVRTSTTLMGISVVISQGSKWEARVVWECPSPTAPESRGFSRIDPETTVIGAQNVKLRATLSMLLRAPRALFHGIPGSPRG